MSPAAELWDADEERRVRFLLGAMTEAERVEIEDRLFTDPDFHDEMLATSDDLIRAYLVGKLPEGDRSRFEQHFLASPRRRERYEFLRSLVASVAAEAAPAARKMRPSPAWIPAAAVLLLAAATIIARLQQRVDGPRIAGHPQTPAPTARVAATAPPAPRATVEPATRPVVRHARAVLSVRLPTASAPVDLALDTDMRTLRLEV